MFLMILHFFAGEAESRIPKLPLVSKSASGEMAAPRGRPTRSADKLTSVQVPGDSSDEETENKQFEHRFYSAKVELKKSEDQLARANHSLREGAIREYNLREEKDILALEKQDLLKKLGLMKDRLAQRDREIEALKEQVARLS